MQYLVSKNYSQPYDNKVKYIIGISNISCLQKFVDYLANKYLDASEVIQALEIWRPIIAESEMQYFDGILASLSNEDNIDIAESLDKIEFSSTFKSKLVSMVFS